MKVRFTNNPFASPLWNLVCMAGPGRGQKINPIASIAQSNQLLSAGKTKEALFLLEQVVLKPIRANTFGESFHPPLIRLVILYETTGFLKNECAGKVLDAKRRGDLSDILTQAALMTDELASRELVLAERWMLKRDVPEQRSIRPGTVPESTPITLQEFSQILTRLTSLVESVSTKPAATLPVIPPPAEPKKPAEPPPPAPSKPSPPPVPAPPPVRLAPAPEPPVLKLEPKPTPPKRSVSEIPVLSFLPKPIPKPAPMPTHEPEPVAVLTEAQQRAQQSCRHGQGMLSAKRYKEGIPHFKLALEADPESTKAQAGLNACAKGLMDLAEAALSRGEEKGAGTFLSQAEGARPTDDTILERMQNLKRRLAPVKGTRAPARPTPAPAAPRLEPAPEPPKAKKEEEPTPPPTPTTATPAPLSQKRKVGRPPLTPLQIARKRQIVIDWLTADPRRIHLSAREISAANAEIAGIIYNRNYFRGLSKARAAAKKARKEEATPAIKRDTRQEEVIKFLLANPGITTTEIMRRHHRIHHLLYKDRVFPGGIKEARAAAEKAGKEKEGS